MSSALSGEEVVLVVEDPASSGTYVKIAEQTGVTIDETVDGIDMSSKDSRSKMTKAGRYQFTITTTSLNVATDAGLARIKSAFRAGTKLAVRTRELGVDKEQADCIVTGYSRDNPDVAPAVVSLTLEGDGDWSAV